MKNPKVIIYCRVGSKEQLAGAVIYGRIAIHVQDNTRLAAQIRLCQLYADHQEFNVTNIFIDDGFSGTTLKRPQLDALRGLVAHGHVTAVIIQDWARLSRNTRDLKKLQREFARRGTQIRTVID